MTNNLNVDPGVLIDIADKLDDRARQLLQEARGFKKRAKVLRRTAGTLNGLGQDSTPDPVDVEEDV